MRQISRTTLLATGLMLVTGAAFAQGGTQQHATGGSTAVQAQPATPATPAGPATHATRPATPATP
ncbi:hypothetical protein, partial [Neoroseomonas oryzicola]